MKIKVITIHNIPNFGSVLQAYALCQFLKDNGYNDVEVVDYNPKYFKPHTFRTIIAMLINFRTYRIRKEKFTSFVKKNIPLTQLSYNSIDELRVAKFEADIFIAGGDQLWNVYHDCGKDDAYKITFFSGKKISYATSLGQTDFSNQDLKDLKSKIANFSAISVRETTSVDLLKNVGVQSVSCVDPVFLLPASYYEKLLKPVNEEKYLLVYLVTPSQLLEKTIKYLSKKYKLKIILCSGFSKKCTCDVFLKNLGPDEILGYVKNAEIILSSSFHATSLSLIFEKQFFTILPDTYTNERIVDLLKTRGILDRIVTDDTDLQAELDKKIDYSQVNEYDIKISNSKSYLLTQLKK